MAVCLSKWRSFATVSCCLCGGHCSLVYLQNFDHKLVTHGQSSWQSEMQDAKAPSSAMIFHTDRHGSAARFHRAKEAKEVPHCIAQRFNRCLLPSTYMCANWLYAAAFAWQFLLCWRLCCMQSSHPLQLLSFLAWPIGYQAHVHVLQQIKVKVLTHARQLSWMQLKCTAGQMATEPCSQQRVHFIGIELALPLAVLDKQQVGVSWIPICLLAMHFMCSWHGSALSPLNIAGRLHMEPMWPLKPFRAAGELTAEWGSAGQWYCG